MAMVAGVGDLVVVGARAGGNSVAIRQLYSELKQIQYFLHKSIDNYSEVRDTAIALKIYFARRC